MEATKVIPISMLLATMEWSHHYIRDGPKIAAGRVFDGTPLFLNPKTKERPTCSDGVYKIDV